MAHGAGGSAADALITAVFRPAFDDAELARADDGAVLARTADLDGELVMTTDSFVVRPLRFPGGSIGTLAVCGTVNDLAVMGATPQWLAASFVIEEGFAVAALREIVADMASVAVAAGVRIVAGDTKVVERGSADGCFVTTTGVGVRPERRRPGHEAVCVGDRVLVSGSVGRHGMAVMMARGDLGLEADIVSDCAPLQGLVAALLDAAPATAWMRDATRGGLASALNELVRANGLAVEIDELAVPVDAPVAGACELLGIDPLHVANEGTLVAIVPEHEADAALVAMRSHPLGAAAAVIGVVHDESPGLVTVRTAIGGSRILDMLVGDPLPRIC
jgi:hydrogenase expression/formation protein HypE